MISSSPTHKPHKPTILVIEDNADQWFIIHSALLDRFPEVEAAWMQDVDQAVVYLEAREKDRHQLPKLILLDLYLPLRQQGLDLLETLKANLLYRNIPVVILSQSEHPDDVKDAYILRGNSYIVKPTSYEKWLDCIASFRYYWWHAVTLPTIR